VRERERKRKRKKERKKEMGEVFCWRKQGGIMIWAKVLTTNTAKCVSLFSTLGAGGEGLSDP
jgi:hypothetical protein